MADHETVEDLPGALRAWDEQGLVSVCRGCTGKVAALRRRDGTMGVFFLNGTPHPSEGACRGAEILSFYSPYAGYSGAELLEEHDRLVEEDGHRHEHDHA